jgi:hypothetical protein
MFGIGSLSGVGFGNQNIKSASYATVGSNQIVINIDGLYTSFNITRTNISSGNTTVEFDDQTGSTFIDNTVSPNSQYSYSIVPMSTGNPGPTFPLQSVWTLVDVTLTQFSYDYNSVQINWTGTYKSILVTRTSPTTGAPSGSSDNYPLSSTPQSSVNGYIIDTGLPFNTYIYTIVATNNAGVETIINSNYITSIPSSPPPTFGTPANVTSTSYGTYNYWIVTGNTTLTFLAPTEVGYLLVGGGGSGGATNFSGTRYVSGGGGGGGGGVCWSEKSGTNLSVDTVATYSITIGSGGVHNINSGNGHSTTFSVDSTVILTAGGGRGGSSATTVMGGAGGNGGTGTGGKTNIAGGAGGVGGNDPLSGLLINNAGKGIDGALISLPDVDLMYQIGAGGGGGSGTSGNGGTGGSIGGGNGTNSSVPGESATYYGGGGGGAISIQTSNDGYQGYVVIYY